MQDWPTILRLYAYTQRAIETLLPRIKSPRDWDSDVELCRRLEAADLKREMLNRRRRRPAQLAAALVAFECRRRGERVQALTILKMWKQRTTILPETDRLHPQ